jgi:hypothetical protein
MDQHPHRRLTVAPSNELQLWAGRLCLGLGAGLGWLGYHFANIRFLPVAAGFSILAAVCYFWRQRPEPSRSLSNSGQQRAL